VPSIRGPSAARPRILASQNFTLLVSAETMQKWLFVMERGEVPVTAP
jgi:hypothetical protein